MQAGSGAVATAAVALVASVDVGAVDVVVVVVEAMKPVWRVRRLRLKPEQQSWRCY